MFVYSIFVVSYVGIWECFPNYDQDCPKIPWTSPLTFNEFSEIVSTLCQLYRTRTQNFQFLCVDYFRFLQKIEQIYSKIRLCYAAQLRRQVFLQGVTKVYNMGIKKKLPFVPSIYTFRSLDLNNPFSRIAYRSLELVKGANCNPRERVVQLEGANCNSRERIV